MRTLLLLLVSRSHARLWSRSVAIANAAGPTGVAALGLLRGIRNGDDAPNLRVCALCRDGEEAILCRRAVCGSVVKEGIVRDMCERSFPSLSVSADLGSSEGEIAAVLRGYTTLVVLMDDIHPSLVEATALTWLQRPLLWSIRASVPAEQHGSFYCHFGKAGALRRQLRMENSYLGYVCLVDRTGTVRWHVHSNEPPTDEQVGSLAAMCRLREENVNLSR